MSRDTRDRILDALRSLLARGGAAEATLENVAAEAGVSKGGLLYHFPSKDALFHGLVERTRDSVASECAALGAACPDDPSAASAAVVRAYLEYTAPRDETERGFITALIDAARRPGGAERGAGVDARQRNGTGSPASRQAGMDGVADADQLSGLFAEIFAPWVEMIRSAVPDPVLAEIILQTGNGWYLSSVCGLPAPEPAVFRATVDRLVDHVSHTAGSR